jgi:hypothetical protein
MSPFSTSPYHDSLNVRHFMFNDIEKTLCLTLDPQAGEIDRRHNLIHEKE